MADQNQYKIHPDPEAPPLPQPLATPSPTAPLVPRGHPKIWSTTTSWSRSYKFKAKKKKKKLLLQGILLDHLHHFDPRRSYSDHPRSSIPRIPSQTPKLLHKLPPRHPAHSQQWRKPLRYIQHQHHCHKSQFQNRYILLSQQPPKRMVRGHQPLSWLIAQFLPRP